jgi:lantibiotic modifying enzyme
MNNKEFYFSHNIILEELTKMKEYLCSTPMKFDYIGLMGGELGVILFLINYYELTKDRDILECANNRLCDCIERIDYQTVGYSFAYGASGLGWLIDYIYKKKIISSDSNQILKDVDNLIFENSIYDLSNGKYDYLSKGLGASLYFLGKPIINVRYIEEYIMTLMNITVFENDVCFVTEEKEISECNFGLSHGIPSIIAFLILCHKKNVRSEECVKLLRGFINFLLMHMNSIHEDSDTFFPYSTIDPSRRTRLGWCYGDLGVGYVIHKVSKLLRDKSFANIANVILLHTAKRFDNEDTQVRDACLCHGSAGIAHMFNKLFNETQIPEYGIAANHWYVETLRYGCNDDAMAGYRFFKSNVYVPMESFLEGIAGVGLVLLSKYFGISTSWDESLLLSC